jgi:hypothetical protein
VLEVGVEMLKGQLHLALKKEEEEGEELMQVALKILRQVRS